MRAALTAAPTVSAWAQSPQESSDGEEEGRKLQEEAVMSRRHLLPQSQTSTTETIDPANFVSVIDNPYFSMPVGTTFVLESPDGTEVNTIEVTNRTKVIMGRYLYGRPRHGLCRRPGGREDVRLFCPR